MTDFDKLKAGDKLSETTYYEVISKNVNSQDGYGLNVKTHDGQQIRISKDIVEKSLVSADQYDREIKVSATQLAEVLTKTGSKVFTVSFNKLPEAKDINTAIDGLNNGKFPTNNRIKATVNEAFQGKERILRGYVIENQTLFGRVKVIDLDIKFKGGDPGYRLVDLRSLNWVIFEEVKYILK